jgi:hypothetical protein
MLNAHVRAALLASLLFGLPLAAPAHQKDAGQADDRLVDKFTRFAGSKSNAEALVNGLRNDQEVKLTSAQGSASFTPKTDKMGFGNVNIALSLAKATLAEQGIHRPTPEQIKAALNGGTVTNKSGERVVLPGVLKQRASGMGWGKIAQANGLKLGEVMRHGHHHHHFAQHKHHDHKHADFRHDHKHADWKHDHKHADSKHDWGRDRADWNRDRGDFKQARFDRPARPEKLDRPERAERPERPHRK